MKDYLKEMEELMNPMKKIYDQMNPMKDIIESMCPYNNYPNLLTSFETVQNKMEYTLNPLKQLEDEMKYTLNPLRQLQEEIEYLSNPFKSIQDEMNLIFANSLNQFSFFEKSINPMKNAIEALTLMNNSGIFKIDELNEILKSLNLSSIVVEENIQNKIEKQIDSLTNDDQKLLDEVFDIIKHMCPDISYLSEKLSQGKYIAIIIFIVFYIPTIYSIYEEYFKQNVIHDISYKINRNNVRVRTEPSTDSTSNILIKLNKNVYVEKIDSHKNWLKVEFENDNGEEIQGWIRRDMLTKIENE